MNTEQILIVLFSSYMIVNMYLDVKYKETPNRNHYSVFFIILFIGLVKGILVPILLTTLITLTIYLIFRNLPFLNFGAGDVKMLVNTNIFWVLILTHDYLKIIFVLIVGYLLLSFLYETCFRIITKNWKGKIEISEAIPIFIVSIILFILKMGEEE